jgi:uncharacterized protein with PQ loop repeat
MIDALDYAPIAATVFAVPQFVPQVLKFRATRDTAGVSWAWATLTCLNNAAWLAYFALEHYWTALVPSSSATALAGTLAILLCVKDRPGLRPSVPIAAWAAMLVAAYLILGRTGLGALLTAAFVVQVAPSIWTAYRTERPTGLSAGTWLLILGELSCWLTFGLYKSDPRLITLGLTGVTASALMLARIRRAGRQERASLNRLPGDQRRLAAGQQPAGDGGDQRQPDQQDQHVTQRHVAEHRGQAGVCPR